MDEARSLASMAARIIEPATIPRPSQEVYGAEGVCPILSARQQDAVSGGSLSDWAEPGSGQPMYPIVFP